MPWIVERPADCKSVPQSREQVAGCATLVHVPSYAGGTTATPVGSLLIPVTLFGNSALAMTRPSQVIHIAFAKQIASFLLALAALFLRGWRKFVFRRALEPGRRTVLLIEPFGLGD